MTRSPNSSGCWSASAMIVMPPIEWPTSTSGPVGAVASITAARSRPSWSMVACSAGPGRTAPCPRWSQNTSRQPSSARSRPALVVPAVLAQREPWQNTTVTAAGVDDSGGPSTSTCSAHAVVGGDRDHRSAQLAERLVGLRVVRPRNERPTAYRSAASPTAAPAATTPTAPASTAPRRLRSAPRSPRAPAGRVDGRVDVDPRHPRADPGDDLVGDRARRRRPSPARSARRRRRGRTARPRRRPPASSSPRSSTNWSMQTRPATVRRPAGRPAPARGCRRPAARRRRTPAAPARASSRVSVVYVWP